MSSGDVCRKKVGNSCKACQPLRARVTRAGACSVKHVGRLTCRDLIGPPPEILPVMITRLPIAINAMGINTRCLSLTKILCISPKNFPGEYEKFSGKIILKSLIFVVVLHLFLSFHPLYDVD